MIATNDETTDDAWFQSLCDLIRLAVPLPAVSVDALAALASHEAGHAVVDHATGLEVSRVAIVTVDDGRAYSSASGDAVVSLLDGGTAGIIAPFVQGALAGILAEAMVSREPRWTFAYADLVFAKQFAEGACSSHEETDALLGRCIEEAKMTLGERWSSVLEIAELLEERGELAGAELETLLEGRHPSGGRTHPAEKA